MVCCSLPDPTSDSEGYYTPYSSLSENGSEHRTLVQIGTNDSGLLFKLQKENATKGDTINKLEREVNQLKKRLKYAEQLEEQNLRLTTEESKHEEEKQTLRRELESLKRKASVSHPLTRSYAHEQKLQELAQHYEQQYHDELEENSRLQEKISQLEKEIQGQEEGTTHIDEVDDPDLNAELRRKDQHVHTLQEAHCFAMCLARVDFPIPGLPSMRTLEPLLMLYTTSSRLGYCLPCMWTSIEPWTVVCFHLSSDTVSVRSMNGI